MEIYIVRHGIAEAVSKGGSDEERELTSEGKEKIKEAAAGFARLKRGVDRIFSSPLVRAKQTAEILGRALKVKVEQMKELGPSYTPADICEAIRDLEKMESIMLVGHEPNCSELASYLLAGNLTLSLEFKKGGICLIESDDMDSQSGTLIFHLTPQILRLLSNEDS